MDRFQFLSAIESRAAYARGKGYGAHTVKKEVKLVFDALNRKPHLAVDIGGNRGDYTAALRQLDAQLEIHVFEPSPTNVAKLKGRFHSDSRIKIVPLAVSESSGEAILHSNAPGSVLGSLVKRNLKHFGIEFEHEENISTVRFEEYWSVELQHRNIDIVKLDIEGHELHALKGFGDAIRSIEVIQFEFGGCNIDTRTYFRDFWQFFQPLGFDLFRIGPWGLEHVSEYQESNECFLTTNFIARKSV